MTNREQTLTTFLVIAVIGIIGLAGALIAMNQENEKYKTILDVSCQRASSTSQCKAGMKILMDMSPEEIRDYKNI